MMAQPQLVQTKFALQSYISLLQSRAKVHSSGVLLTCQQLSRNFILGKNKSNKQKDSTKTKQKDIGERSTLKKNNQGQGRLRRNASLF